ncbi:condensin-2 complex subunit D3-like [Neocloeon triangulifer]|uniref:condensin-2 complex subunit D3-like n=1 Tax=Neocloeon triangulifer TaxID=2078957 RepID=UPI00286F4974|nr:condensin-2 complex subunit D3-like [Neocloeon triangulifer]
MEIAAKIAKFVLPLDEAFVEQAWLQELSELGVEPFFSDDDDLELRVINLIDASEALEKALVNAPDFQPAQLWADLTARGLHHRNILPYISYFSSSFAKNSGSLKADTVGLASASLFFKMLSLPGAVTFNMFHQIVFDYAVDKLNLLTETQSKEHRDKKQKNAVQRRQQTITKRVTILMEDLTRLLRIGFVQNRQLAVNITVKKLAEILSLENKILIRDFETEDDSFTYRAYIALYILCSDEENICLVLEHLLSTTLSLSGTPSQLRCFSETLTNFIKYLLITKEPKDMWPAVMIFMQHLLTRSVERAENRQKVGHLATILITKMPKQLANCVVKWVFMYLAFSERSTYRLMVLELFQQLLQERQMEDCSNEDLVKDKEPLAEDEEEEVDDKILQKLVNFPFEGGRRAIKHSHIFCLALHRSVDVAPLIRTKALNMLAEMLMSACDAPLSPLVNETFVEPFEETIAISEKVTILWQNRSDFLDGVLGQDMFIPGAVTIVNNLVAIAEDERVYVRKAALHCLVSLGKLSRHWISSSFLELVASHCRDPAPMIRKQAIVCLTELLKEYFSILPIVINYWVSSVMPCLQDPESKVQELVQEQFHDIFFDNLRTYDEDLTKHNLLPWNVMRLAITFNLKKLLSDTLNVWAKGKNLPSGFIKIVMSYIGTNFNKEAWTLLAIISESQNIQNVEFAQNYFKQHSQKMNKTEIGTIYSVLRVLMLNAKSLSPEQTKQLRDILCTKIENLAFPTDLIGCSIDTVAALDIAQNQISDFDSWCKSTFKRLELKISMYLSKPGHAPPDSSEEAKLREITTLGDVMRAASISNSSTKATAPLISIALFGDERPESKKLAFEATPRMRAIAVVALGKIAILHEQVAFEVVVLFQHLLKKSSDNVLRCNILAVLADLIGKYATLVESIVAEIEICLHDPDPDMRRHALVVVVQLLQGDFVKLRGNTLLFYLLSTLCDPEDDLRDMTASYLTNTLIAKEPNAFQQNLIAAIILLNAFEDHERFSKIKITQERLRRLALPGPENKDKRMIVYSFMLEHMSDDHRFDSMHRICTQILGGFIEGNFLLGKHDHILEDALSALRCEHIRLRCMNVASDAEVTDADEAFNKLYEQTKKIYVAHEVKKKIVESIVPIIRSLRIMLQKERSPLANELMQFLRDLMKDFKSEIDEIFAGDRQLVEEIAFDIRQLEEQEGGEMEEDDSD